jgi:hypothetical protein
MRLGKTLANIVTPIILSGTALFSSNSFSQNSARRNNPPKIFELDSQNPSFSDSVSMNLYNRSLSGTREFSEGKLPVYLEGEMDYESGKFYFSYSVGRMTSEGPLLNKKNIEQTRRIPLAKIPAFDDTETQIYVVSTGKGIDVENIEQKAFIHGSRRNPVELYPLEEHKMGSFAWWAMNKGFDYAIEKGDAYLTGGISLIPYVGDLSPEVLSTIVDKFDLGPLSRTKSFFERRAKRLHEEGRRDALSSLENAIYVQEMPLFPDVRHKTARSFEMNMKNNSFEDEQVSVLIKKLAVGNKSNYGNLYGNVDDISFVVNLPPIGRLEDYGGRWEVTGVVLDGKLLPPDEALLESSLSFSQNYIEHERYGEKERIKIKSWKKLSPNTSSFLAYKEEGYEEKVILKKISLKKLNLGPPEREFDQIRKDTRPRDEEILKNYLVLERVN